VRRQFEARKSAEERVADAITRFTGSMRFVYIHAVWFGAWIVINLGLIPGIRPFDPFPFVVSLLAEHEITRLISLVDAVAARLGVQEGRDAEVEELKRDVAPETVLRESRESEQALDRT
jgi:uncharacterized membrane protein